MTQKPTIPLRADAPERVVHTWLHMFDSGLLWYLNRTVFNPIGFALALDNADDPAGWSLHYAGAPVTFADDVDEAAKLAAFHHLLQTARVNGVSPPDGWSQFANPNPEESHHG